MENNKTDEDRGRFSVFGKKNRPSPRLPLEGSIGRDGLLLFVEGLCFDRVFFAVRHSRVVRALHLVVAAGEVGFDDGIQKLAVQVKVEDDEIAVCVEK